jgi:hypothetical protein
VATPQVGEKEVSYPAVTEWIADKLKLEFQVIKKSKPIQQSILQRVLKGSNIEFIEFNFSRKKWM